MSATLTADASSRALILCADDYALHPLVDDAVQQLARAGRLSATSCMTTAPRWREAATALRPLRPLLSVGLHFNLTEAHAGGYAAHSLGHVISQTYARRWTHRQMQSLWCQQLDAFEQAMGGAPDFIDGHQHVHQLPVVRDALLAELAARYPAGAGAGGTPSASSSSRPWIRSTAPARGDWRNAKALTIALLGGWTATRQWRRAGLSMNQGFAGVYGFDAPDAKRYGAHMQAWLTAHLPQAAGLPPLLMCHPATAEVPGDAIGHQRPVEFAYLMSPGFGQLLNDQRLHIHQGAWPPAVDTASASA